jgi:hypothetical protein
MPWDFPANIGFIYGAFEHDRKDILCKVTKISEKYRAFHNVLRDYKNL